MKRPLFILTSVMLTSACVATTENLTPKDKYLNRVAFAEIVMRDCPADGGYSSFAQMRSDAASNMKIAKSLGATDTDIDAARKRAAQQYGSAYFLAGPQRSCDELIKRLAWAGAEPVQ
ncbi:hypothetical protein LX70_02630 [Defluviimonas denitrificans]|uniref:Lipoprotein n=1 Tax=Albidovulum denitrificans TaxID=404881 RepID=A0A2S8S6F8_9RHOB|nr:hypothetical protein [Defluviimonas denitrificans]PQV56364.1 hypothetical protein LX70_02630 [Defluviimonas denitrificans]